MRRFARIMRAFRAYLDELVLVSVTRDLTPAQRATVRKLSRGEDSPER